MAKVILHTESHPEDNCVLQALYSRSADSVVDHIEKLKKIGSGKFMNQYYIGYGHSSIADCGYITIYIEGVSMLCAKAFQDNPLYSGQESSSRYIDWSEQPFYNPFANHGDEELEADSEELLTLMRQFYVTQKSEIIAHLTKLYPKKEDEKQLVYEKAISAKAFDILRGYLPCGATTNVSWTTSLRKANEHLQYLSTHPLKEVRDVAAQVHADLLTAYPNSIAALLDPSVVPSYLKATNQYYTMSLPSSDIAYEVATKNELQTEIYISGSLNLEGNKQIEARPKYATLPKHSIALRSRMEVITSLDFGSYRDLQRHRGGYCGVPIIYAQNGFHPWYYDQLPIGSKTQVNALFNKITEFVEKYNDEPGSSLPIQYLLPMGTLVPIYLDYGLHQAVYVAELRSGQTVHPTLRPLAQEMAAYLEKEGIPSFADKSPDAWTLRRGTQDITKVVNPKIDD